MKLFYGLLGLVLLLASAVQADSSMTTLQLHNRPAEEIIPIVKPMLGDGRGDHGPGLQAFPARFGRKHCSR